MENINDFEKTETKDIDIKPLVNEKYNYDNIINNPVLKPISETDRSLGDIEEMILKYLQDSKNDYEWVNSALSDAPEFGESNFVMRLLRLVHSTQNIIKLQDLRDRNLKRCIKEMFELVKTKYGIIVEEQEARSVETVLPKGGYEGYLTELEKNEDKDICRLSKNIMNIYKDSKEKDLDKRYEDSCTKLYMDAKDKKEKVIIAKIMRMEI